MLHFSISCKIIVKKNRKSCKAKRHVRLCYSFCLEDIFINVYICLYVFKFNKKHDIKTLHYPWNRDSHGQETFLAPSADKHTRNYGTECSNQHIS